MLEITTNLKMPFEIVTKEGQKALGELTKSVAAHNEQVSRLTASIDSLRAEADANLSVNYEGTAGKLRANRAGLLESELGLRDQIREWLERAGTTELFAYVEEAISDQDKAEQDVRKQLEAIGFIDDEYGRVMPSLIAYHPRVRDAKVRRTNVQGSNPHQAALVENASSVAKAQEELESLRTKALSGLGV